MSRVIGRIPSHRLEERGSIKLDVEFRPGIERNVLIIRYKEQAYAWLNACPHWGIDLGSNDEEFWTVDKESLVCQMHQARFRPDDGYCTSGPCRGRSLMALPLEESDGEVRIYKPLRKTQKNG
ncbi:MAG: Rieske (2Fe-2S) protein [Bacteroidota bacterium]